MDTNKQSDVISTLTRVMTGGIIMSIERNERELETLTKILKRLTGREHISLANSRTASIHQACFSYCEDQYNKDVTLINGLESDCKFCRWLRLNPTLSTKAGIQDIHIFNVKELVQEDYWKASISNRLIIDLTPLGFGPIAAFATNDKILFEKAERLKIFGAFDLRTMWTQEESAAHLQGSIQFNYRLSPLVAACANIFLKGAAS